MGLNFRIQPQSLDQGYRQALFLISDFVQGAVAFMQRSASDAHSTTLASLA